MSRTPNKTLSATFQESIPILRDFSIHTYHSRFIPEGVAEVSQILLRVTHFLPKLVMRNTADVAGGKPIAV
jgi:hypothetical protein